MGSASAQAATSPLLELHDLSAKRTLQRVDLTLVADHKFTRGTLAFDVTAADGPVDLRVYLPPDAHVVGLAVTHDKQPRVVARRMFNNEAHKRYTTLTGGSALTAVVELAAERTYMVRVGRGPAHVELELRLPVAKRMWLKSSRGLVRRTVAASQKAGAGPAIATTGDAEAEVSALTSLFADEPGHGLVPTGPTLALQAGVDGPVTDSPEEDRLFRLRLRNSLPGLTSCVPSKTRVDVSFAVLPSGQVSGISVAGQGDTADAAHECISKQLTRLRFRAREDVVMMSFPVVGSR